MYIVKTSSGEYEDYRVEDKFVTSNREIAQKWVSKYNRLLEEYTKSINNKLKDSNFDLEWDNNKHSQKEVETLLTYSDREIELYDKGEAWFEEIEIR